MIMHFLTEIPRTVPISNMLDDRFRLTVDKDVLY